MSRFSPGWISDRINRKTVFLAALQFVLVVTFLGYRSYQDTSAECMACHGSRERLEALGYPQFYVTQAMVEKESRHQRVRCRDCHLGNGRAKEPDRAHQGMLRALLLSDTGEILERRKIAPGPIVPHGDDRIRELLPPDTDVRNVLWQDRNPETLNFDPAIAKKTCGRPDCHPDELEQFRSTVMGTNFRQRTMRTWTDPYGPHNCGPSFADTLPLPYLEDTGYDFRNTVDIVRNLNTGFSRDQASDKQRFCNVCHTGCLDCHYAPDREKGVHTFIKRPRSETCAGNGRGTSICHPGAMQSRRGETYIGGDYSIPTGMVPDVHYTKDIHCVDCHETGEKGMGDMQRKAACRDCHLRIEDAHKNGVHRNMDCAACHISELRGYQITAWGPGKVAGRPNPFKKYSLYYGIQKPPLIMKDQKGVWMPVKVWPHSVGNIRDEVRPSDRIEFRWPRGETRDAYYIVGTVDGLPANNRHLLWIEIEQAAHPFGKARSCENCHQGTGQVSVSTWEFQDSQGSEPFTGTHRIEADEQGLRIEGIRSTSPIRLLEGYAVEDFAPWVHLTDRWKAPGDFSIRADKEKYKREARAFNTLKKKLLRIEHQAQGLDKKAIRRFREARAALLHNPEEGMRSLDELVRPFTPDYNKKTK